MDAEVKQLRNELKKTDKLRERLAQAEEQNRLMRAELKQLNTSPVEIKKKNQERIMSLLRLFRSFNSGDAEAIKSTIASVTSSKCSILTPSLFQELRGINAVTQFFCIMLETFPDGLFELSETELEASGVVISKFSFTGTKISPLPSDLLYEKWKDLSLEEIYKKRAGNRLAPRASLETTFLNIRAAPTQPGGQAAAIAAASQVLPQGEITDDLIDCMIPYPQLKSGNSVDSLTSEQRSEDDQKVSGNVSARWAGKHIKISGHIITTYDASTEEMNRIIFVWNTTSLLGQLFGFSDGDLEELNGVVSATQQGTSDSSNEKKYI